jgi:hypothetical protein
MLIDAYLPVFDSRQVVELDVNAPVEETYAAIRDTDLRDPLVNALFAVRELPTRIIRRWRGKPAPGPRGPVTLQSLTAPGGGFILLGEHTDCELVLGSVGKFWRHDYGSRQITREEFAPFAEPGYAKLAVSICACASLGEGTTLRHEARTSTTDEAARRAFGRYWRIIRPGVALVMRRALVRIGREAERRLRLEQEHPALAAPPGATPRKEFP